MRNYRYTLFGSLLASSAFLLTTVAQAEEADVRFSGFATLAYGKTISDEEEGQLDNIPSDMEYRDFNKFGVRLDADLKDKLTFTAQLTANGKDDYSPEVDWLFATYNFMPNLSLSVGKLRTPLYMYSDYLDVGYAYQWISTPYAVYGQPSFNSTEGAKLTWLADMGGSWTSELQIWGGNTDEIEETFNTPLLIEDSVGVAWAVEREWLTLRAVYFQGVTSADITSVLDDKDPNTTLSVNDTLGIIGLSIGESMETVSNDFLFEEEDASFIGLGMAMDFEHTFYAAEATSIEVDKNVAVGDLNSYYVMAGVRLPGNWSLSLTYAVNEDETNDEVYEELLALTAGHQGTIALVPNPVNPLTSPPVPLNGVTTVGDLVQGVTTGIDDYGFDESQTYILGSRWDFHAAAALKMEYIYKDEDSRVGGVIVNQTPQAFRIALDLVF